MSSGSTFLRGSDVSSAMINENGRSGLPFTMIAETLAGFLLDKNDQGLHDHPYRLLKAATNATAYFEKKKTDYAEIPTYFGVLVLTLVLVMIVDLLLHTIDHRAHHHSFIRDVLNTAYKELAILGIVEWFMHFFRMTDTGYDWYQSPEGKSFSQIHWFLFFTAIANAVLSSILYFCCRLQTKRWWVQAEDLEINHYVELRQEFDKVQHELGRTNDEDFREVLSLKYAWKRLVQYVRDPRLEVHYKHLLIQVRFHELRVHFINANKLPKSFKFSEYLRKCEQQIFKGIAKISLFAWLVLTALANLAYFLVSMIYYHGTNQQLDASLPGSIAFYCICVVLVLTGYAVYVKVKWIFSRIINTDLIESVCNEDDSTATRQLHLFWWHDPENIISVLQVFLFVFSMVFAFLAEFHELINYKTEKATEKAYFMAIVSLICFSIFIVIMTRAIPKFTLCTSIGQLVKKKILRELLGKHRLRVALRIRTKLNQVAEKDEIQRIAAKHESIRDLSVSRGISAYEFSVNQKASVSTGEDGSTMDESKRFKTLEELVSVPTGSLPEARPAVHKLQATTAKASRSWFSRRLEVFFLANHFRTADLIFGTMICFFFVGLRMEALGETLSEKWSQVAVWSCWLEFSWLLMIILGGCLKIYVFKVFEGSATRASMFYAGFLDICIGILCLTLLIISIQRTSANQGIGIIEPFTSLIALRVFFIPLGQALAIRRSASQHIDLHDSQPASDTGHKTKSHSHGVSHNPMDREKGTVVELWQAAVGHFPDIVETYGEFSSELFQAMLGLPPLRKKLTTEVKASPCVRKVHARSEAINAPIIKEPHLQMDQDAADIEALVIAGKTGLPVKANVHLMGKAEDVNRASGHSQLLSPLRSMPSTTSFELDEQSLESEVQQADDDKVITLIDPDAPLICSMRRCERILLPFLEEWTVVDVILTDFELVYLDANIGTEMATGGLDSTMHHRRIRNALIATKGGRQLRLRDVIVGRKIVGHIDVQLISSTHVQCHLAPARTVQEMATKDIEFSSLFQSEYWKPLPNRSEKSVIGGAADFTVLNQKRWGRVEENQLKIVSLQGVLYLRFFCDLENAEKLSTTFGTHTEALVWCQKLSRLSSGDRLEMPLDEACLIEMLPRTKETNPAKQRWKAITALTRGISSVSSLSSAGKDTRPVKAASRQYVTPRKAPTKDKNPEPVNSSRLSHPGYAM